MARLLMVTGWLGLAGVVASTGGMGLPIAVVMVVMMGLFVG